MRNRRHQRNQLVDETARLEVDRRQLEPPRLDARQVEHVVQQREQRLRRGMCRVEALALGRLQRPLERQLDHPEHAAEWRPDLVAHVGQEVALGDVGGIRDAAGSPQPPGREGQDRQRHGQPGQRPRQRPSLPLGDGQLQDRAGLGQADVGVPGEDGAELPILAHRDDLLAQPIGHVRHRRPCPDAQPDAERRQVLRPELEMAAAQADFAEERARLVRRHEHVRPLAAAERRYHLVDGREDAGPGVRPHAMEQRAHQGRPRIGNLATKRRRRQRRGVAGHQVVVRQHPRIADVDPAASLGDVGEHRPEIDPPGAQRIHRRGVVVDPFEPDAGARGGALHGFDGKAGWPGIGAVDLERRIVRVADAVDMVGIDAARREAPGDRADRHGNGGHRADRPHRRRPQTEAHIFETIGR